MPSPQVCSSTIYNFTTQRYPHSQQDMNALALIVECHSTIFGYGYTETVINWTTNFVLRCYPHLTVEAV